MRALAADADADLADADRALLAYAAQQAWTRGLTRVAIPRMATAEQLGLSQRAVREGLQRLCDRGVLSLAVAGRPSSQPGKRRANLFELAQADAAAYSLYRETRSMGHPARPMGRREEAAVGHRQTYGPAGPDPQKEHSPMVTVTITAETPKALVDLLGELTSRADVDVQPASGPSAEDQRPDNVRHLRAVGNQ